MSAATPIAAFVGLLLLGTAGVAAPAIPVVVLFPHAVNSADDGAALSDVRKALRHDGTVEVLTFDPAGAAFTRAARDARRPDWLTSTLTSDDRASLCRAVGAQFYATVGRADKGRADVRLVNAGGSGYAWTLTGEKPGDAARHMETDIAGATDYEQVLTAQLSPPPPSVPAVTQRPAPRITMTPQQSGRAMNYPSEGPAANRPVDEGTAPAPPALGAGGSLPSAGRSAAPAAPQTGNSLPGLSIPTTPSPAQALPNVALPAPTVTATLAPPATPVVVLVTPRPVIVPAPVLANALPNVVPPAPTTAKVVVQPTSTLPAPVKNVSPPTSGVGLVIAASGSGLVSAPLAPTAEDVRAAADAMSRGDDALARSDPDGAVAAYRAAVNATPLASLPRLKLARAYLKSDMKDRALDEGRRALLLAPDDAEVQQLLTDIDAATGTSDGAVARAAALAVQRPDSTAAHLTLGDALWNNGQTAQAEDAYKQALALSPTRSPAAGDALAYLARLYAAQSRYAECLAALRNAGRPGYALALSIVQGRADLLASTLDSARASFDTGKSTHEAFYKTVTDAAAQTGALSDFVSKVEPPPSFGLSHAHRVLATQLLAQQAAVLVTYAETGSGMQAQRASELEKAAQTEMLTAHAAEAKLGLWNGSQSANN